MAGAISAPARSTPSITAVVVAGVVAGNEEAPDRVSHDLRLHPRVPLTNNGTSVAHPELLDGGALRSRAAGAPFGRLDLAPRVGTGFDAPMRVVYPTRTFWLPRSQMTFGRAWSRSRTFYQSFKLGRRRVADRCRPVRQELAHLVYAARRLRLLHRDRTGDPVGHRTSRHDSMLCH